EKYGEVWDIERKALVEKWTTDAVEWNQHRAFSVWFSDDSSRAVVVSTGKEVHLLELPSGKTLEKFSRKYPKMTSEFALAGGISTDHNRVAIGTSGCDVEIWLRRRPESWWGIGWLPTFWIALVFAAAGFAKLLRNYFLRSPDVVNGAVGP